MSAVLNATNVVSITKTIFRSSRRTWISLLIQTQSSTGTVEELEVEIQGTTPESIDRLDKQLAIGEAKGNMSSADFPNAPTTP